MAILATGRTVASAQPTLLVENRLEPGSYRFQLVCVDDAGNASAPALLTVTVQRRIVIRPEIPRERIVVEPVGPRVTPIRPRGPGG
jgi:hypothetical protein